MKTRLIIAITGVVLAVTGCSKDKSPAFMVGCYRKEVVSSDYHIPDMTTPEAATYLQSHLRTIVGYESSKCDLPHRTLTISYQSSIVRKMNFEETIALLGFSVNARPANPSANIPDGVKP